MANKKKNIPLTLIRQYYLIDHLSLASIGKIFGVAPDTVKARLREIGVKTRDSAAWIRGKKEDPKRTQARADGLRGKKHTAERRRNQSTARINFFANGGKNWSDGYTKDTHPSLNTVGARKEEHWNWQGGISELAVRVRNSHKYDRWKKDCLERDEFKCVRCESTDRLAVHHIVRFNILMENITTYEEAIDSDKLFEIENGETLCFVCHNIEHKDEFRKRETENEL